MEREEDEDEDQLHYLSLFNRTKIRYYHYRNCIGYSLFREATNINNVSLLAMIINAFALSDLENKKGLHTNF
jgi:hypothetical protein